LPTLRCEPTGQQKAFQDRLTIGRGPNNDLVIDDPRVSTNHAKLAFHEGRLRVMDLNSKNGTFVDGIRIGRWVDLVEGSVLTFGTAGPYHVEGISPEKRTKVPVEAPTVAATDGNIRRDPTRLTLFSKDLSNGTIVIEQGIKKLETEGSMRFLLLYILAQELLEEPDTTPEPNRGWLLDESLRIKLWGVRGAERRDPSSLGKLIHDTRLMFRREGIDPGFIEKRSGATRIALLPSQVKVHGP
jgi:hypothetical protein